MRRVFISFKMEDKKQVDGVRLMAWNKNLDLDFYDESVRIAYKSDNDDYIKKKDTGKDRSRINHGVLPWPKNISLGMGKLGVNLYPDSGQTSFSDGFAKWP